MLRVTPWIFLLLCLAYAGLIKANVGHGQMQMSDFSRDEALEKSQSVVGQQVGDHRFLDSTGKNIRLSSYFGKPLVVSLIYTSCFHICPTTTRHLSSVIEKAREALGDEGFNIISVGFDVHMDKPQAMGQFAEAQNIDLASWQFLSADQSTIDQLSKDLGFIYYPSPNGFDHLIQTSILDEQGRVYRQVYGMDFDIPLLIDPLKALVFSSDDKPLVEAVSNKVRLFCTVYDPARDKYRFDYSIFIGTFIGFMCVLIFGMRLVKEWRLTLRS